MWRRFHYLTAARAQVFEFRGSEFVPVRARSASLLDDGVVEQAHAGGVARVTTLERTLVDVLDVPRHCGGWEEIWRSLELVEFFDLDAVVALTIKRGSALTAARVGFFLEQHRELLMVEDRHLDALRAHAPAQPLYLDRKREPGKVVRSWNLVVPERILERRWEEQG
jgi:predicted transcriptional regulator of viral defense system